MVNKTGGCSCGQGAEAAHSCGSGCSCGSDCDGQLVYTTERQIIIDFLYLDLNVCSRCQGTDTVLDDALTEIAQLLKAIGAEVVVNKINVLTEDLAVKYRFVSSPTIRVNGRDIQIEVKESLCESCGDLCGDEVDCRVWVYQGQEYTVPPKAMLIDAILNEVYGPEHDQEEEPQYVMPENLKRFYAAMARQAGNL